MPERPRCRNILCDDRELVGHTCIRRGYRLLHDHSRCPEWRQSRRHVWSSGPGEEQLEDLYVQCRRQDHPRDHHTYFYGGRHIARHDQGGRQERRSQFDAGNCIWLEPLEHICYQAVSELSCRSRRMVDSSGRVGH